MRLGYPKPQKKWVIKAIRQSADQSVYNDSAKWLSCYYPKAKQ
jgi:hypothetical protein